MFVGPFTERPGLPVPPSPDVRCGHPVLRSLGCRLHSAIRAAFVGIRRLRGHGQSRPIAHEKAGRTQEENDVRRPLGRFSTPGRRSRSAEQRREQQEAACKAGFTCQPGGAPNASEPAGPPWPIGAVPS